MPAQGTHADALDTWGETAEFTSLHWYGAIAGIRPILFSGLNGVGVGRLRINPSGEVSWKAPGSATYGPGVLAINEDATVVLEDGEDPGKYVRVEISHDYVIGQGEATITLTDVFDNALSSVDVAAAEASAGDTLVVSVYLKNVSTNSLEDIRVWIEDGTYYTISLDGVNYYAPDSESHSDVLYSASLAAGASLRVYAKREIPGSTGFQPTMLIHLGYSWNGG